MFYEISRGVKAGKNLTTAQRASSKFAEEPVVLGKVLRRGYPPIRINEEQYQTNLTQLKTLEKAGAISIKSLGGSDTATEPVQDAVEPSPAVEVEVKEELPLEPVADAAPVEAAVNDQITDAVTQAAPVVEEVVETKKGKKRKE